MFPIIIAVGALLLFVFISRGSELFCLSIRAGKVLVVRGRVPGAFLNDVRELVAQQNIQRGTIRGLIDSQRARLSCSHHIDEGLAQRLRNTFALYPMSSIRGAPRIVNPSFGQLLGIGWLAWMIDSMHD